MINRIKMHVPIVITAVIVLLSVFVSFIIIGKNDDVLATQAYEITTLENEVDVQKAATRSAEAEFERKVTGLDSIRKKKDDETMEKFLEELFSWKSLEEYNAIRDKIMKEYDLDENSRFIKVVMREVAEVPTDTGTTNEIDAYGYNMKFRGLESSVTKVTTSEYSYFAEVKVETSDKGGNKATGTIVMTYNIDIDGNITGFEAYTAVQ